MNAIRLALVLSSFPLFLSAAENGELQVITLKDGSTLRAHVSESMGGYYIIKSPALGDTKIRTSDVIAISPAAQRANPTAATAAPPMPPSATDHSGTSALQAALASKVQSFVSSGSGMATVTQFTQNPDLKAVLADPNLMNAIQSGDSAALMGSPAIRKLMENPQTKALIQSILSPNAKPSQKQ